MFKHTQQGAVDLISGDDPIDAQNLEALQKVLDGCVRNGQPRIVLDLESVPLLDSVGLEFLLDTLDACTDRGGTLRIAAPNGLCRDIFKVTGVSEQFEFFENTLSALGSFAQ